MRNNYFTASVCVLISSCCGAFSFLNNQDASWKRAPSRLDRMPLNFGKRDPLHAMSEETSAFAARETGSKWLAKFNHLPFSLTEKNSEIFPSFPYDIAGPGGSEGFDQMSLTNSEAFASPKRGPLPAGQNRFPADLDKRLARLDRMPLSFGKRSSWPSSVPWAAPAAAEEKAAGDEEMKEDRAGSLLDETELISDSPSDRKLHAPLDLLGNLKQQATGKIEDSAAATQTDLSSVLHDLWARCCGHSRVQVAKRPAGLLDRMPLSFGRRTWEQRSRNQVAGDRQSLERRALLDRMPLSFGKRAQDLQNVRAYQQAPKSDFGNLHLATALHKSAVDTTQTMDGRRQGASEEMQ